MKRRGRGIACMWYPIGFTVAANPSAAVVKINEDGTATLLTGTVETGQGSLTILGADRRRRSSASPPTTCTSSRPTPTRRRWIPAPSPAARPTSPATPPGSRPRRPRLILFDVAAPLLGVKAEPARGARPQNPRQGLSRSATCTSATWPTTRAVVTGQPPIGSASSIRRPSRSIPKRGRASRSRPTSTPRRSPRSTSTTRPARSKCCASSPSHDCGTPINPMLVEGQVEGGISMGVGFALQEEMLFDANGRQINPNLTNYIMPTSLDMPEIEVDIVRQLRSDRSVRRQGRWRADVRVDRGRDPQRHPRRGRRAHHVAAGDGREGAHRHQGEAGRAVETDCCCGYDQCQPRMDTRFARSSRDLVVTDSSNSFTRSNFATTKGERWQIS